jgi:hypothetical protein
MNNSEDFPNCTICLIGICDGTKVITDCEHIFHKECLYKWLNNNNNCPYCRNANPYRQYDMEKYENSIKDYGQLCDEFINNYGEMDDLLVRITGILLRSYSMPTRTEDSPRTYTMSRTEESPTRSAEDYIINPVTGRHVLRTGAIGRRILRQSRDN